jgi:hypothetical protein
MRSFCRRIAPMVLLLSAGSALGCRRPEASPSPSPQNLGDATAPAGSASSAAPKPRITEAEALRARPELPPERRAMAVVDGSERWVDAEAIESVGYTIVDLRDDWTPAIFRDAPGPDGAPLPNRYKRVFLGLASDTLDSDGNPLDPGEKNYLELYGLFPTLTVLSERFDEEEHAPCHDPQSVSVLEAVETVTYVPPQHLKRDEAKLARIKADLEAARRKAKLQTLAELAQARPEKADDVALVEKRAAEKLAMTAVEKRLTCEKLLTPQSHHQPGIYDEAMRLAVRRFQQKHMIYEANFLRRKTVDALARPPLDNDYDSFVRVLRERVVAAAAVIEDGTATGGKDPALNLADEYTQIAQKQLGLTDTASVHAFFKRHPKAEFKTLRAAVKLPTRPEYYSDQMDLSIVVDRGDVWYDIPFDSTGNFKPFARKKYPTLTLFVNHKGKRIALARWRTTIGGWRSEQAPDGYEYYRYKMSDVGSRVIRQIVAGPVWIAPTSTPVRSLVKGKTVNGGWMKMVNYDELGPGYLSAYGLVAGYFVIPGEGDKPDSDRGVRAHGSSDYLSIYSANGFSHGCHRLPNHIAIRMYSFILSHRNRQIKGDEPLNFTRQFMQSERVYEMRVPSRGYVFELDPPLPVEVLEGNIRGTRKTPVVGYVPKPGVQYPGAPPTASEGAEARAGGGGEG